MLDDVKYIAEIDKSNMLDTITNFPEQIQAAVKLMQTIQIPDFIKVDNVLIAGMGASGISGDLIQSLFRDTLDVPVYVNKDSDIPKWANKHTLAIFLSYSGNTEETLNAFKIASQKKCKIISVTTGGKLQELCENRTITFIKIPSGLQPRAAFAYLFIPLLFILEKNRLIKPMIENELEETLSAVSQCCLQNNKDIPEQENLAKQIARKIFSSTPQIYGWGIYAPVAKRWRAQFNENSKIIARDDVVSECNHNDIVGWSGDAKTSKQWSCLLFRDKEEESLILSTRLDFMNTLFEGTTAQTLQIFPKGKSRLSKLLYMICLGDFVSCYLAVLRGVDPTPVDAIMALKQRLIEL